MKNILDNMGAALFISLCVQGGFYLCCVEALGR